MNTTLEWCNEEEGLITVAEKNAPLLTAQVFVTGPEEAEFRIQDVVFLKDLTENSKKQPEITCKMTKCLKEVFELLWEEGFEEVVLVEKNGSALAKILHSTNVVEKAYSEYMMCRDFKQEKSTASGMAVLQITPEPDGYMCKNEEQTFFCRLLPYDAQTPAKSCFYLYEVEVDESKRNKGIATACLTALFRELAAEANVTIYLQVGSYNEPAVHLYEKLGFEISEELCYYTLVE